MMAEESVELCIWVDGDACPNAVKEILFRTAARRKIQLVLVANTSLRIPNSNLIKIITVSDGPDEADKRIAQLMNQGDIVVTGDIPLAASVVEQGGIAIGTRGELYDDSTVQSRLASRNLSENLRAAGFETRGPKPHSAKDTQSFANQLDRMLTKLLNG